MSVLTGAISLMRCLRPSRERMWLLLSRANAAGVNLRCGLRAILGSA